MSKFYVVATPIGNLSDMTARAIETLKNVALIACEDTRVSSRLLAHYNIATKTVSYHQHSDAAKARALIDALRAGRDVALITDAGTPGISDPGNKLVAQIVGALAGQVEIIPIPGPSALATALSASGLPTDRFLFLGFLPHKKGRETLLTRIVDSEETVIFYESTHRIIKALTRLAEILEQDRPMVVGRELTKKFEHFYRGSAKEVLQQIQKDSIKGEFVVIVGGRK